MARFGSYEVVRELSSAQGAIVYLARKEGLEYAVKLYSGEASGDTQHWTRDDFASDPVAHSTYRSPEEFSAAVRRQQSAAEEAGSCIVPILESGKDERGAWCAMPFYKDKLKKFIGVHLKPALFHELIQSLAHAALACKKRTGAGHGNIRPSNIFITRDGEATQTLVSDPRPMQGRAETQYEKEDLHAIGEIIYHFVRRKEVNARQNWPLPAGPEWNSWFGKQAERWRELTNRLLDPNLAPSSYSLEQLQEELNALQPKRQLPVPLLVGAAVVLIALIGGGVMLLRPGKPKGVAQVEITSIPEGAEVWIDGQNLGGKATPYQENFQHGGEITFELKLPDHETLTVRTNLVQGRAIRIVDLHLKRHTGKVLLKSEVAGVECFAGTNFLGLASAAGAASVPLPVGKHTIRAVVRNSLLKPSALDVIVVKDSPREVSFDFPRGGIILTSSPPGAVVFLNGKELGNTPYTNDLLNPGDLILELQAPDHNTAKIPVQVVRSQRKTLGTVLGRGEGTLHLTVDPPDAEVVLQGQTNRARADGVVEWKLPAGPHILAVQHASLKPATLDLIVQQNKTVAREFALPYAKLRIESQPSEAEITKDGRVVGKTAGTLLLDPGSATYELKKVEGGEELSEIVSVVLASGQQLTTNVTLTAGFGDVEIASNLRGAKLFAADGLVFGEIPAQGEPLFRKTRLKKGVHELVVRFPELEDVKVRLDVPRDGLAKGEARFLYGTAEVSVPAEVNVAEAALIAGADKKSLTGFQTTASASARLLSFPILRPGELELTFKSDVYQDDLRRISVRAGEQVRTNFAAVLQRARGTLSLTSTSEVKQAEILLNGKVFGTNLPWSGDLEVGDYSVAVRYQGFATTNRTVRIAKGRQHAELFVFDMMPARYITNGIGMELVWVPRVPGTPDNAGCWVGRYEVTKEEYAKLTSGTISGADARTPVVNVTWPDVLKFCQSLSQQETKTPVPAIYTLPTSAQWDYFSGEKNPATSVLRTNAPSVVGSLAPTKDGLHDVWGNVWEWCFADNSKVTRGCSFRSQGLIEGIGGAAAKAPRADTHKGDDLGFRVILVPQNTARAQK